LPHPVKEPDTDPVPSKLDRTRVTQPAAGARLAPDPAEHQIDLECPLRTGNRCVAGKL